MSLNLLHKAFIAILLFFCSSSSWAMGACRSDVLGQEAFDRQSWESTQHVYIGLVTEAELSSDEDRMSEVTFTLEAEKVFKGNPRRAGRIYTQRPVIPLESEVTEVVFGVPEIMVGDRLIIFSNSREPVFITA